MLPNQLIPLLSFRAFTSGSRLDDISVNPANIQYITTNHLVLIEELKYQREKLKNNKDNEMRTVIEQTIKNLEEKQRIMEESKKELIFFYSQLRNILQQLENMSLKSSLLAENKQLFLELKQNINEACDDFSDANSLLDDISKL